MSAANQEDVKSGDFSVTHDNHVESCIIRWLAKRPRAPWDSPRSLNNLWGTMRRIDEVWMSRAQFARDAIQCIPSNVAADRQENNAILGVEFCNSGAATRRIALTEHLLQIAEQKRFDRLLHDGFPSQDEAMTYPAGNAFASRRITSLWLSPGLRVRVSQSRTATLFDAYSRTLSHCVAR